MGWLKTPTLLLAKFRLHWCASGLYRRKERNWICPDGPWTLISARFARPSQIFLASTVPSSWIHVLEPVNGCCKRSTWFFQLPSSQSKSCDQSCFELSFVAPEEAGRRVR